MKEEIKNSVRNALRKTRLRIVNHDEFMELKRKERSADDLHFLKDVDKDNAVLLLDLFNKSKSENRQDLFALSRTRFKRNGFFVEFGATNGIDISNTYLLEKEFSWRGILAEPARCWQKEIVKNRNVHIEYDCVWKKSGRLVEFSEVKNADLSTISLFNTKGPYKKARGKGKTYNIATISLIDLLKKYNAPGNIDYLSLDTEGSEYEILKGFDFNEYRFSVITCEHNFGPNRRKIHDLLSSKGYKRKYEHLSKFDDWYILQ